MKVVVFDSELRYIIETWEGVNKEGLLIRTIGGGFMKQGEEKSYEFDYSKTYVIDKKRTAFYRFDGTNYIQIGFKEASAHGTLANYIQQWNYGKMVIDMGLKAPKDDTLQKLGILSNIVLIISVLVFAWVANGWVSAFNKSPNYVMVQNITNQNHQAFNYMILQNNRTWSQINASNARTDTLLNSVIAYDNSHP